MKQILITSAFATLLSGAAHAALLPNVGASDPAEAGSAPYMQLVQSSGSTWWSALWSGSGGAEYDEGDGWEDDEPYEDGDSDDDGSDGGDDDDDDDDDGDDD